MPHFNFANSINRSSRGSGWSSAPPHHWHKQIKIEINEKINSFFLVGIVAVGPNVWAQEGFYDIPPSRSASALNCPSRGILKRGITGLRRHATIGCTT